MKQTEQASLTPQALAALVEQAKAGSQDAYTAIYRATSPELYRSIHAMVRSDELCLDIQQDTYVFAFTHLDQLGDPTKLRAWLHAIALNRTRSVLRKQTPVLFSELENGDGPQLPELADESPEASPELRLEQKETARYVREILDSLTAGQRMLVGMYYYEQLSVGQIARELEISPGTVKSQLYRGRKKIEQAVQRLEKQGVKLYGLSPLPFLLALLKREEPPAEAGRAALRGVLSKTAAGSAGEAAAVTGAGLGTGAGAAGIEAAAVHVGRSFFQTLGGRVVLGLLVAAAVGGGVLGYGWARDQFNMGNVQPTTEPIQILHSTELPSDSDEDLILVSTEAPETGNLDSAEDLTEPGTEPTTEPSTEPTEPSTEPTRPTPTQPAAQEPADPSDPTNPGSPGPGGTGSEPAPQPTDPTEPTIQTDPTEPEPSSQGQPDKGFVVISWDVSYPWGKHVYGDELQSGTIRDIPYYADSSLGFNISFHLNKMPRGNEIPTVSSDNPRVAEFTDAVGFSGLYDGCKCSFESYGPGTAHITVDFGGGQVVRFTVINPEYPETVVKTKSTVYTRNYLLNEENRGFEDCYPHSSWTIEVIVQGFAIPELTTDNPAVFQPAAFSGYSSGDTDWIRQGWKAKGNLLGPGDAHVYLKLNGEIRYTWTIHAYDDPPEPESTEPTEPTELAEPAEPTEPVEP